MHGNSFNFTWSFRIQFVGVLYTTTFRVDYGLDLKRKKKLAVPFVAADLPSDRSEFSHPDIGIVKTILSYYYEGLSFDQMSASLKLLVSLGPSAQKKIYQSWFESISSSIDSPSDRELLDDHRKIDFSNASLVTILFKYYEHCVKVIDF